MDILTRVSSGELKVRAAPKTASATTNIIRSRAIATAAVWAATVAAVGFGWVPVIGASSVVLGVGATFLAILTARLLLLLRRMSLE